MKKDNSKIDIWLMRFTSKQQCEVLRQLKKSNSLRIKLSTVCNNNFDLQKQILNTGETLILSNNSICYLEKEYFNDINLSYNYDFDIYSLYNLPSYHNYIALQILERFERYKGEISFEERNYLIKMQYIFWSRLLIERKPNYVIFGDIPHMYYELVLMDLLSKFEIKSLIVGNLLRDKHYFMDNNFNVISSHGNFTFTEATHERMEYALNSTQTQFDKILNKSPFQEFNRYLKLLFKKTLGLYVFFFSRKKYFNGYYIKQGNFKFGPNSKFNELFYELKYALKCITFPLMYDFYSSKLNFKEDYIYMPLLSGYENGLHPNLSPLIFKDIIKSALSILKPNQFLYIKEHPAQFVFRSHQRFARDFNLYRDILNLDKRIKFIKIGEKPSKIIKNSYAVCAINFTSTFVEAKAFKKKIYCLGSNLINGKKSFLFSELNYFDKEIKFIHEGSPWVKNPIQSLNIIDLDQAKQLAKSIQIQIENN